MTKRATTANLWACVLSAALLAMLAVPSTSAIGATARRSDTTTVTLGAIARESLALNAEIARFEQKYPNIVIKPSYLPAGTLVANYTNGFTNGGGFDMMELGVGGAGSSGLPTPWQLGTRYLLDLSSRPWTKDLWKPLLPLESAARKVYAEPLINSVGAIWFNTNLFDQLGVKPPRTWGDLLADCNRIADQGKIPFAFAGGDALTAGIVPTYLAASTVYATDANWSAERAAGKVTFEGTPGWHQALQSLLDMQNARCFEPSPQTETTAAAYTLFNSGQAVMMLTGTSDALLNVRSVNPSLNLGFFPIPGSTSASTRVLINPLVNLAVNANSPVKQAAVTFLDYIARAWQSVAIANAEDSISSLDLAKGVGPADLPLFAPQIKNHQTAVAPLAWANNTNGVAVWRASITALLAGTKTIDQVLTQTDAAW